MPDIDLRVILEKTLPMVTGDLVTRRTGQAIRSSIERVLADHDGAQTAVIDFSSVRLIDLSCADEIVAKLLIEHGEARCFLLRGVSEGHRDALEPVLERRGLAAAVQDRTGHMRVLGRLTDDARRAFAVLSERGTTEAGEVAVRLSVPAAAARDACRELLDRRLAIGEAGGSQVVALA